MMTAHLNYVRNLFFLGGFILPSILVQALVACPRTSNGNICMSRSLSKKSSMLSMSSNNDIDSSASSEENDGEDGESGSRQHRLAKAQAEIDRILNNPIDPPFDFEKEMKKVASISPPLIKEGSAEFQLEEQVSEAEDQLYKAVKAQDYDAAEKKSAEISQTHVDDCGLVLQANAAFYRAFSEKDIREMDRLWLKDRSCVCIHPSFKPITGVNDIMKTWKRMFESSAGSFQRTWIDPCEIQLTVKATTAVVTCVEDVYARRFVRGKKRKSELVNKLTATNIFRKVGGRWYMTYHHSSWHADSEAAKRALKSQNRNKKTKSLSSKKISSPDPFDDNPLINLRSKRKKRHEDNDDDESKSDDRTEIESILGIENFGPILGDDSEAKQERPTGSSNLDFLKDLGLGGLGGIDGILGMGSTDGTGLPPGSIIRISKVNNDVDNGDDDGEEIDDYDDDQDDEDFDEEDEEETTTNPEELSVFELLDEKRKKNRMKVSGKLSSKELRQRCIDALRKLANDGRISPKQKRVLLTDIISSSARGEKSLVVHAYKLLCVDPTDEEAAEEDFVDQCQVFAQSFFEIQ
ncbi:unnamed protein product [Pseudo-nitzschia multistriata]|uniref:SnoaL-like domain-containing protein n=1 Tax=Pseudo-nitzschia multistriata TaxID=183589 RepID=A0A448ZSW6_9STRA|nr:unnamed protein product [Pseudo-nitzschia multistriata]